MLSDTISHYHSPLSSKTKCALARIAVFTPFLHRFVELSIALASCAGEWVFIAGFLRWHVPSSGHAIEPAHNVPSPHAVSPSWSSGSGVLWSPPLMLPVEGHPGFLPLCLDLLAISPVFRYGTANSFQGSRSYCLQFCWVQSLLARSAAVAV